MKICSRILLIFVSCAFSFAQSAEELKKFMDTYDKLKLDQEANEVVKKGIESEKDSDDGPVRILIEPGDVSKYYQEKMKVIQKDLNQLNRLLLKTDSIPPLTNFGYNYFSLRDTIQFIDNANVSSNYILGFGDEVIISIWGQAEQYVRKTLERDGTIFVENVGLLYLGGKTQSEAKSYIKVRFGRVYSSINSTPQLTYLEFSIGKIKNINISVAGHVQFPGNYVVNPSISISNILILSGGIKETGSLRNIYLQRDGVVVDTLDLYPLITGIGNVAQININENDIIVVPPRGATIAVSGNVLIPAYFEINQGENISKILMYNGASKVDQVILARFIPPNLFISSADFEDILVTNGDSLIVPTKYIPLKSISISVSSRPFLEIPWSDKLTFAQILDLANVYISNIRSVELIRIKNNQNIKYPFDPFNDKIFSFNPYDHIQIHLNKIFLPSKKVVVKGEINSPGTYALINNNESLNSIIKRAGGLNRNALIENVIIKRDTLTFGSKYGEIFISAGDTILARSTLGTVKIEGEVHQPGILEWGANNKAKQYISEAGGLTAFADKKHIVYITPYGKAIRISSRSNIAILPGSTIRVSEKPVSEQERNIDRFQQISNIVGSLVSIAILASAYNL